MADSKIKYINAVVNPTRMKQIAITCRCGHRFIYALPIFMDETCDAAVLIECEACQQPYSRHEGHLVRLNRATLLPEKTIHDQHKTEKESEVIDDAKLDGKVILPSSNTVQ